jgi:hypothetical protein
VPDTFIKNEYWFQQQEKYIYHTIMQYGKKFYRLKNVKNVQVPLYESSSMAWKEFSTVLRNKIIHTWENVWELNFYLQRR